MTKTKPFNENHSEVWLVLKW